jgi:hypothetical protein
MNVTELQPNDRPTAAAQRMHLLLFFFGAGSDVIELCVNRAYRDFNRTLHELRKHPNASGPGRKYLYNRLKALPLETSVNDEVSFDAWHRKTCHDLIDEFKNAGYTKMHVGQSQKWLNMALKYIFLFDEAEIDGYIKFFPFCHVPIDNIILKSPCFDGAPSFGCAWSRIDDYKKYIEFQNWARAKFSGHSPLAVEFEAWAQNQNATT